MNLHKLVSQHRHSHADVSVTQWNCEILYLLSCLNCGIFTLEFVWKTKTIKTPKDKMKKCKHFEIKIFFFFFVFTDQAAPLKSSHSGF